MHPIADGIIEQLEIEGESHVDDWLQSVQDRLSQAESLEDFRNGLDSLIPELDFSEYGKVMAWASTTAYLAGKQSVMDETNGKV
ncbi:Mu-like prophage protein gp29 [Actinobacillus equuli]|nr:Mu-like prophage protein gp29 [Actinobacillus equuli]